MQTSDVFTEEKNLARTFSTTAPQDLPPAAQGWNQLGTRDDKATIAAWLARTDPP